MGPGHRGAVHRTIPIARQTGAHIHTGGADVGLGPPGAIARDRTAAAVVSDVVISVCRPDGERSLVDGGRILNRAASRTIVAGRGHDDDSGCPHPLDDFLQHLNGTLIAALNEWAGPGVVDHVRCQAGYAVRHRLATDRIGRQEEFEAFGIRRGLAIAPIHVTAANPARPRRDADLVGAAVVTDNRAHRVRTVAVIVARLGRIGATDAAT